MSSTAKILVIAVVVLAIIAVIAFKKTTVDTPPAPSPSPPPSSQAGKKLPALYEFGAGKCVQCKKMAPIIEALAGEFRGTLDVRSFNVYEDKEITEKHRIITIPCQLILDADGKERFRHEGFIEKEAIVKKLSEMGVKPHGS